jgi:hypothetical protein
MELKIAMEAAGALAKLAEQLAKVIDQIKDIPPDKAVNLADALDEVHKEVEAVLGFVARYRSLAVRRGFEDRAIDELFVLEGPRALVSVREAGGSCVLIENIFQKHLDNWLALIFQRSETYAQTARIFFELARADGELFSQLESACRAISEDARIVGDLARQGRWLDAHDHVRSSYRQLQPLEANIATVAISLYDLRDAALRRAKITSLKKKPAAKQE